MNTKIRYKIICYVSLNFKSYYYFTLCLIFKRTKILLFELLEMIAHLDKYYVIILMYIFLLTKEGITRIHTI